MKPLSNRGHEPTDEPGERAQRLVGDPSSQVQPLSADQRRSHVQDLELHCASLEMQNEELRRTQREIEHSRERYVALYDFSPAAYLTLDAHGVVLEINLTGAAMVGVERAYLIGKSFIAFLLGKDHAAFLEHVRNCIERGELGSCELDLCRHGGEVVRVRLVSDPFPRGTEETVCRTIVTHQAARHHAAM
ncbi:MAG: PAS domain-containing protein [Deltaproteobacteria bacterium]|nr:PAS domain-containing protein [Deltaproteobacteria bacterium]